MHPFSVLTLGIFVAGYITARWDLVTRLYELAIFAWDHGVVVCVLLFGDYALG
jgi:phosphatidylinositol glycan class Q protein